MRTPSLIVISILTLMVLSLFGLNAQPVTADYPTVQINVASYELLGSVNIPTGTQFEETEIGGLSSITYDHRRGVYYAISDDQGTIDPVRFYTLEIDLSDGQLDPEDISFIKVTTMLDQSGSPFAPGTLDPEGLVLARGNSLYFTSEGFASADPPIDPFISRMKRNGQQKRLFRIPYKFLPDGAGTKGVRNNLAFESLNVTPDQQFLITAVEGALAQDGPTANIDQESFARIIEYRLSRRWPGKEFVYVVNPIAELPNPPDAFRVNGLVELLPLDDLGTMLAMERSFSVGAGNTVWIYEIETQNATNVARFESLYPSGVDRPPLPFTPVTKRLIVDIEADLNIEPDNLEGMAFGPALPDGRLPLVLVSDNNFNAGQSTQFIVLAVELDATDVE
ncbi:MAG: esterase-like activity of phytase family protein [Ardenticatenaceae bacterium]|nr:esterase-like activity of phytase family protein [Ardenticatenaceae bacterium]